MPSARPSWPPSSPPTRARPQPRQSPWTTPAWNWPDGIEAKQVILTQLTQALEVIRDHDPARIATLGGECAVSVAPFAALARRYGDDPAIIWIDSHPDIGTPASHYPGSTPWPWPR
jgi:hypothetical protein